MFETKPDTNETELNSVTNLQTAVDKLKAEFTRLGDPLKEIPQKIFEITMAADGLNKSFIGNRGRIQEMMKAVTEVGPEIVGLGGKFEDAGKTIAEVAAGSRRNVLASKEDIRELFATGKVIGQDVSKLVDGFAKVGIMFSDVSENVVNSISYVNSIGVNAKAVMGDVLANTDQLSRFNFEGGVRGLTKMAAQASMLRFDMKETFELADKVLDPDKAIEVASAFQRLGVSAGNLTDPFMLMNQSINDPSGLQDSLINVAKQFTYFDKEANQFKINPQGILTLREMEAQTGVSAKAMREAALSAADFDKRLGDIKKTGKIAGFSEDDQKLITNLSRMTKDGYEIKVREGDKDVYRKLADVNEQQLKATLESEKTKQGTTIEDVQRNQLNIQEGMLANLKEINEKILRGITGNDTALVNIAKLSTGARKTGKEVAKKFPGEGYVETVEKYQKELAEAGKDETKRKEILGKIEKEITVQGEGLLAAFKDAAKDVAGGSLPFANQIDSLFKFLDSDKIPTTKKATGGRGKTGVVATKEPTIDNDFIFGRNKTAESVSTGKGGVVGGGGVSVNETVEVKPISGKIDINVTATGASPKIIEDMLSKASVTLKERIFEIVAEQSKITPDRIK